MVVIVTDPKTKRDVEFGVTDEHVKPDLDEQGHVRVDNSTGRHNLFQTRTLMRGSGEIFTKTKA